jgi:hypothetical protein
MPERMTLDLDVIVPRKDAAEVRRCLTAAGFQHRGELSIEGATWESPDGETIDVLESDAAWLPEALAEAEHNRDAQGLPVLPLAFLTLMKLEAGRVQDLADVTRMLGQANEKQLSAVRQVIKKYDPSDADDLESLIALGRLEFEGGEGGRPGGG